MDNFDIEILKALQSDSRIGTVALGELVGLSPSACQRRIKKLKEQGVIDGEVAQLNTEKLPGFITAIIDVTLEKGGEVALDKFIHTLDKASCVQQFYYVAGEADFVVIIVVKNMTEYDKVSRQLFMSDNNVKKFSSKIAIKSNKVSTAIPL